MQNITFTIPSQPQQAHLIGQCIEAICQHNTPLSAGLIEDIQLCVMESIGQVISQSYHNQPDQLINITVRLESDRIVVELQDQGDGLNARLLNVVLNSAALFDPLQADQMLPDAGFSFYLLKTTMDAVQYQSQPHAHTLRLEKYFEVANTPDVPAYELGKFDRQRACLALAV